MKGVLNGESMYFNSVLLKDNRKNLGLFLVHIFTFIPTSFYFIIITVPRLGTDIPIVIPSYLL